MRLDSSSGDAYVRGGERLGQEENGLPVEGRHLSCRRQIGTDLQPK